MPSLFPFKSLQGQTLTYGGKESIGTDAQVFSTNYIALMKDGVSVVVGEAK
jgi:branched-chain amino acid transport system substrate-binding protein